MDRREFLAKVGLTAAGAGMGLVSVPDFLENPYHKYYQQLMQSAKSISVYELEGIIGARALLFGKEEDDLANWKNHVVQNSDAGRRINEVRQNLVDMSVFKAKKFIEKSPRREEIREVLADFDSTYGVINEVKESEKLHFVEHEGKTLLLNRPSYAMGTGKPIYATLNGTPLVDRFTVPDLKSWPSFSGPDIDKMIITLSRMAPEALFIARVAKAAKISLEESVALAYIESFGREFALSNTALGMLQINFSPDVLKDNYRYAISRDNELTDYLKKNTSKDTLLEDLSSSTRVNFTFGINLAEYKKQKMDQYYVAAYNIGIEGVSDLPKSIKYKLRNPGKITERDLSHHSKYKFILKYQRNFLTAKNNFSRMRGTGTA